MAEFDDDQDFNSEQVQKITENAVQAVIGGTQLVYQRDKVNQWTQQIIEQIIKELAKLCKNFKYVVTCIIQQNNGAGIQSAATAYWDTKTDGLISVMLN
jgi:dynein light chain Tctex-type 1